MSGRPVLGWPGWRHLAYAYRAEAMLGLAFFAVYATTNFVTGLHSVRVRLHTSAELAIPLVPAATIAYSSLYAMFALAPFVLRRREEVTSVAWSIAAQIGVAGLFFLLVPGEPAYPPTQASLGVWAPAFNAADAVNLTYNMLPSLHVAFAATCALAFAVRARGAARWLFAAWGAAVAVSTVLTHQHHVVDVVAGAALALATTRRRPEVAP